MSFQEQLKEYFTFTKGESQGILVLIIILFIAVIINLSSQFFIKDSEYTFSEFDKIAAVIDSISEISDLNKTYTDKYDTLNLFKFNPNKLSLIQANKLGLSDYQYNMIQRYLASGASFKYKSDFGKIYSIKDTQYQKLYSYIDLPERKNDNNFNNNQYKNNKNSEENKNVEYFKFDPNTLNDRGWLKLGFSEKQVAAIIKYVIAGGKFFKKEDLKKIYVISDKKYKELEPFIEIQKTRNDIINQNNIPKHFEIDINTLNIDQIIALGGFWKFLATRIIKYRNLLGGFYKKEQLLEVYGFKKQYYDDITEDIIIDKSKIEKININFAEVSELGKHPYISWSDAKKIIEFRNKNGAYKSVNEIKEKQIIPNNIFEKIVPYIKVK